MCTTSVALFCALLFTVQRSNIHTLCSVHCTCISIVQSRYTYMHCAVCTVHTYPLYKIHTYLLYRVQIYPLYRVQTSLLLDLLLTPILLISLRGEIVRGIITGVLVVGLHRSRVRVFPAYPWVLPSSQRVLRGGGETRVW